jgi:dTDP-glucose 4,6-dehydratase
MDDLTLVTGAGGFIGSHLVEALVHTGRRVRAMVHYNSRNSWGWLDSLEPQTLERLDIVTGDITDPFNVRRAVAGCAQVYHLAAQIAIPYSYLAPANSAQTNVMGTLNVLQACHDEGVKRLVHTSTSETYGSAQYVPINEQHPLVGQSPYAASKIGADKLAESYFLSFGTPVSIVRPFNTYGPRQSARAVIPTIIAQALAGGTEIKLGLTSTIRDFNYVLDTVSGFMSVMESDACVGRVTNIGSGTGVKVEEVARLILKLCGSRATLVTDAERVRPEASEVLELVCDASLARRTCGWVPRHDLETGLRLTVEWFRRSLTQYKPHIYNV